MTSVLIIMIKPIHKLLSLVTLVRDCTKPCESPIVGVYNLVVDLTGLLCIIICVTDGWIIVLISILYFMF